MAGAFAFVFGLCALSFAGGCVVTAIMLRRADPAEEVARTVPESAEPAPPAPVESRPVLDWPPDDVAVKPIHRNPVVGLPAPAALDEVLVNSAPAALALAPDPTFTGMVETPPAPWLTLAPEPAAPPVLVAVEPLADQEDEPAEPEPETVFVSRSGLVTGTTTPSDPEPVAEAAAEPVAEAEKVVEVEVPEVVDAESEPVAVAEVQSYEVDLAVVASIVPEQGPAAPVVEADPIAEAAPIAEAEPEMIASAEPEPEPAAELPVDPAVAVEPPSEPEVVDVPVTSAETSVEAESAETQPAQGVEAVADRAVADPAVESETVVLPSQAFSLEPTTVVPKQQLQLPDSEFRQRYLRTFEAARRRSNH
ncbi:hypothetical protein [Umezawaea sp. NPDC059074]|uniref:hypothetical protein n=1 Tax=Umezawaea sp. NPDC059074 TaxID=3346716 RepID=UPI0036905352